MHTLRSLRLLINKNQEEFAKLIGVSRTTICNWERGKGEPSLTQLHRMSDITGVSIDDIFLDSNSIKMN